MHCNSINGKLFELLTLPFINHARFTGCMASKIIARLRWLLFFGAYREANVFMFWPFSCVTSVPLPHLLPPPPPTLLLSCLNSLKNACRAGRRSFSIFPLGQLQLQLQLDEISQILVMQVHFVPCFPLTLPFNFSLCLSLSLPLALWSKKSVNYCVNFEKLLSNRTKAKN